MFKTPILMLKITFFWLLFCGKFEQKTQKSISFKNQWRLKNIKKAMVVKNIIAEDMPFTKSIFEQFWRSYCKKTIFVVFHFLKFLPICLLEQKYCRNFLYQKEKFSKLKYQEHKDRRKGPWKQLSFLNEVKSKYCNDWKRGGNPTRGGYHPPRGVISPPFPPFKIGQGGGYPPPLILFLKNA